MKPSFFALLMATGTVLSWLAVGFAALFFGLRRLLALERESGGAGGVWVGVVPFLYYLGLGLGPLGIAVGAWQLRDRSLARQGFLTLLFTVLLTTAMLERWWELVLFWWLRSWS